MPAKRTSGGSQRACGGVKRLVTPDCPHRKHRGVKSCSVGQARRPISTARRECWRRPLSPARGRALSGRRLPTLHRVALTPKRRSVRVADPLKSVVLRQHFWARVLGGSRISAGTRTRQIWRGPNLSVKFRARCRTPIRWLSSRDGLRGEMPREPPPSVGPLSAEDVEFLPSATDVR
jgi:hypothetical protein